MSCSKETRSATTKNKIDLIEFIYKDWTTNEAYIHLLENKEIYVTVKDKAYGIKVVHGFFKSDPVWELESQQEEADTKMFLCVAHAKSF